MKSAPRSFVSAGIFGLIRANISNLDTNISDPDRGLQLFIPLPFSNVEALRSGLPAQVHLKRGGSATCLKSPSMSSRRAVASVTLRIVCPAVRTSFPAMSITSRRSLLA